MGLRHSSSPLSLRSTSIVSLALAALSACSLTKKEDDAGTAANATAAVVVPAAPVFNVNTPQGTQPAEAAPAAVQPGAVTATGKTKSGTSTTPSTGAGGTTARATTTTAAAQGGTAAAATTTRAAATGGAPAQAATTAAPAAVPQVDMACVNSCGTKLQACITAAGLDGTKLAACQNVLTSCQAECKK